MASQKQCTKASSKVPSLYCSVHLPVCDCSIESKSIRMCIYVSELNDMLLWIADVDNAYLKAFNNEKLYTIAGLDFGLLEGHILIVEKALYRLRFSGAR